MSPQDLTGHSWAISKLQLHSYSGQWWHPLSENHFPSFFNGLGRLEGEYTIEFNNDAKLFQLATPQRAAIPLKCATRVSLNKTCETSGKMVQVNEW